MAQADVLKHDVVVWFEIPAGDVACAKRFYEQREAINGRRLLRFEYVRQDGEASSRDVRPLALYFWGLVWTLAAWCELRDDFRSFRVDRISNPAILDRTFAEEPGKALEDFISRVVKD
jgi:predicted DNA-binding transcriptional regulator YafY